MGEFAKSGRELREEREKFLKLKHRYERRITIAKSGKIALQTGDYGNSIKRYCDYLSILAEVHKCDIYSLRPDMFDRKKELSEMLVISQIFFELSKLFDMTNRFVKECEKALDRYVAFSINQPYQVVNSEVLRKTLRKGKLKNPQKFFAAYKLIQVQSAKCYIATYCFGTNDPTTNKLRVFKNYLLLAPFGFHIVDFYYRYSPSLIKYCENHRHFSLVFKLFVKPCLRLFSRLF